MRLALLFSTVFLLVLHTISFAHQGFHAKPEDLGNSPGAAFARMDTNACATFKTQLNKQTLLVTQLLETAKQNHQKYLTKLNPIASGLSKETIENQQLIGSIAELQTLHTQFLDHSIKLSSALKELEEQPCDEYLVMQNFLDESRKEYQQVHELDHDFRNALSDQVKQHLKTVTQAYAQK